jgi:hypothetical protein
MLIFTGNLNVKTRKLQLAFWLDNRFRKSIHGIGLRGLFANQLYLIAALSDVDGNCDFAVVGVGFYVALLHWLESPPVLRRKMWMMTTTENVTRLCLVS